MSQNNQSVRLVSLICTFSLIYLPIFLLIAYYTDTIYKIGKYHHSLSLQLIIGVMETIKFGLRLLLSNDVVNYESQSSKMKKHCMRLKMKEIFKCGYILTAATAVIYVCAVLFGAPIFSECEETLMFSLFVSVLCILPSLLNVGADNTVAVITGAKLGAGTGTMMNSLVSDMITTNIHLTVLGAWLGAVVIPLDWERPWQLWPIPCCLGAISGSFLSYLFTLTKIIPSFAKVYSSINHQTSKHSRSRNC